MVLDFTSMLIGGVIVFIGIFIALCVIAWGAQGPDCITKRLETAQIRRQ